MVKDMIFKMGVSLQSQDVPKVTTRSQATASHDWGHAGRRKSIAKVRGFAFFAIICHNAKQDLKNLLFVGYSRLQSDKRVFFLFFLDPDA